jgi:hypothetical protein
MGLQTRTRQEAPHTEDFAPYRLRMGAVGRTMQTPQLRYAFPWGLLTQRVRDDVPGLGIGSATES